MRSMPFFSQMVDWEGEDSGFPNREAVEQWEKNCCGIACLRMILAFHGVPNNPSRTGYWSLLQSGLARGAYSDKGWIHRGLLDMAAELGVRGQCHRHADVGNLVDTLRRGSACIVSVTRFFLGGEPDEQGAPLAKGGHLVVAYDVRDGGDGPVGIVCNHPSSGRRWNKPAWTVELEKWERSFSGNYIEFFADTDGPGG